MRLSDRDHIQRVAAANIDDLFAFFARRVELSADAADLVGETMLVVWRRASDAPSDATRARMWMFGIARHVLKNHERGRRRRAALTDHIRDQVVHAMTTTNAGIDHSDLRDAVHRLPRKQLEVITLTYGEGFTLAETAKVMGTSASTTRSRHAYALAALRDHLDPALGHVWEAAHNHSRATPRDHVHVSGCAEPVLENRGTP